jgi:hypothetical protein
MLTIYGNFLIKAAAAHLAGNTTPLTDPPYPEPLTRAAAASRPAALASVASYDVLAGDDKNGIFLTTTNKLITAAVTYGYIDGLTFSYKNSVSPSDPTFIAAAVNIVSGGYEYAGYNEPVYYAYVYGLAFNLAAGVPLEDSPGDGYYLYPNEPG